MAGRLGWAAAGLAVLSRGFRSPRVVVEAHRRPEPPYAEGPAAAAAGATAMIDVSDGLLADLGHVAAASGVAIDVDQRERSACPSRCRRWERRSGVDPLSLVLTGGEDHALVATFPPDAALPAGLDGRSGRVAEGEGVTVDGAVPEDEEALPGTTGDGDG